MPSAEDILRILGPAGGLLVIALGVAVVALWKRLMAVMDAQASQNVLLAERLLSNTTAIENLTQEVRDFARSR